MPSQTPAQESSDAALLAEAAAGGEAAFVELYRRRRDDVYRFAYALTRSRSFAQDATQEVFLQVLENAGRFDAAKGTARAWLLGCARHVVIDRLRADLRLSGEAPEQATAADHELRVLNEQRLARLHAAIAGLPFEYREALALCELAELPYAEAAAVLDCPVGTVRSRLHRARRLLAASLRAAEREREGDGGRAVMKATEVCS
jgi:RNA polymerase sigma-70 factor (ECF subfamily)